MMILIESIKTREVDNDIVNVAHFPEPCTRFDPGAQAEDGYIESETVIGDRFVTADGRRFTLGMTKEVRDVLGLPLDAFKGQQKEIESMGVENRRLRAELTKYRDMNWCQRLLNVFNFQTGGQIS